MFIPWGQFRTNDVLEVQATDTVAQVRDRLLALGGPAQHLSALVVHLPDGRIVPTTVSQLKELAKKYGVEDNPHFNSWVYVNLEE